MIERLKECLGKLFGAIVALALLSLCAFIVFCGAVLPVLPVKWSNSIHDVFTTADQKQEKADELSNVAALNRAEADKYLKELHPLDLESASALGVDTYIGSLIEIRDLYQVSEALEDRASELRRKAAAQ